VIPYVAQPSLDLGPLTIHAFGPIVAASVVAGMAIGARRFRAHGLDPELGERMAWWLLVCGFVGAHLFSVLFYFPEKVRTDPLVLLRLWEDISSFGGIVGGAIGTWAFFRFRATEPERAVRWRYVDVAAYVFPISLMIGRLGCALAHDHPGRVTRFPLAISLDHPEAQRYIARVYEGAGRTAELPPPDLLPTYGFHDLGVYELLYLAVVVVPAMVLLGRRPRRTGFFLIAFALLYMPARFLLDFLRVADARYAGLTPAQWVALLALGGTLAALMWRGDSNDYVS